jgi:exosome complex component CSL4
MSQKKIENGEFVIPGDVLGVEEEFMPGENAFVDGGIVYSSAIGTVNFNEDTHKVAVNTHGHLPPYPEEGDTVIAKVSYIRGQFTRMDIVSIEGEKRREIPFAPQGAVHISQTRDKYVKDLDDQFQIGDIVRARVVNPKRDPIILSTVGDEFGVILAKCSDCHLPMVARGNRLYCETCDRYEKRKVSKLYGSTPL